MDIQVYLLIAYFTLNGFMTGFALRDEDKPWYFVLLGIFFAVPVVIAVLVWGEIKDRLIRYKWFNDLSFWFQLNVTGFWKNLEEPGQYERFIAKTNDERLNTQWSRIKKKYNY